MRKDLHRALRSEVVARANAGDPGMELVVAHMQYGKDDEATGLHVRPSSFSSAGIQTTDMLALLGFERAVCGVLGGECYSAQVDNNFDVVRFAGVVGSAFRAIEQADRHLSACGFLLPRTEGWGYFWGKPSSGRTSEQRGGGDGHTGLRTEPMKKSADEFFHFAFSWREAEDGKGWIVHYKPKHSPLAEDVEAAFRMLRLRTFEQCPEFDFDRCWWRYFPREEDRASYSAAEVAHRTFDAHPQNFSAGLRQLVAAHERVRPFGLGLIRAATGPWQPISTRVRPPRSAPKAAAGTSGAVPRAKSDARFRYDAAISFAGPQRALAEGLARSVRDAGFEVFFDGFYPEQLWGKDLAVFFDEVFGRDSRFCVMLVSSEYVERIWTTRERQSAMARAVKERGNEYILPVRVEPVEVPGLPSTIGYVTLGEGGMEEVATLLKRKLATK